MSKPHPDYTVLLYGGEGLVVIGEPSSVQLVLEDGRRQGEEAVWLLTDAGGVWVKTHIEWELEGMRRG